MVDDAFQEHWMKLGFDDVWNKKEQKSDTKNLSSVDENAPLKCKTGCEGDGMY